MCVEPEQNSHKSVTGSREVGFEQLVQQCSSKAGNLRSEAKAVRWNAPKPQRQHLPTSRKAERKQKRRNPEIPKLTQENEYGKKDRSQNQNKKRKMIKSRTDTKSEHQTEQKARQMNYGAARPERGRVSCFDTDKQ